MDVHTAIGSVSEQTGRLSLSVAEIADFVDGVSGRLSVQGRDLDGLRESALEAFTDGAGIAAATDQASRRAVDARFEVSSLGAATLEMVHNNTLRMAEIDGMSGDVAGRTERGHPLRADRFTGDDMYRRRYYRHSILSARHRRATRCCIGP